jgi:hypothetical protein
VLIKEKAEIKMLKKLYLIIILKMLKEKKIKEFKELIKGCLYNAGCLRDAGFLKFINVQIIKRFKKVFS